MKNAMLLFLGIIISLTSTLAKASSNGTLIQTQSRYIFVQCNNWGWAQTPNFNREWSGPCAPLEAKVSIDSPVYSIANTAGVCPDDKVAAYFFYERPAIKLSFKGCVER